jgi:hypothetical protein
MLVDQVDDLLEARPFKPFSVLTSDGREYYVKSHEFVWHPPASRMLWIYADQGDRAHLIDLHLVTSFDIGYKQNGSRSHKRKK